MKPIDLRKKIQNYIDISRMQSGMSYVELIVVLSIFSVMSGVILFNYGGFQSRVEIKSLASDIALKVVQAQKNSLSGALPVTGGYSASWKPSYGAYFTTTTQNNADNKSFVYFADLDSNALYNGSSCGGSVECQDKITITKGNTVSGLTAYYTSGGSTTLSDLTVSYSRPNSGAILRSSTSFTSTVSYVQINLLSPKGGTSNVKVYLSGRIQVD